jgi:putative phage-type endonuclease
MNDLVTERLTGLGGSDAAAILGEHPYKGAVEVFLEKMGLRETEDNELMEFGRDMEPVVRGRYLRRHREEPISVWRAEAMLRDPKRSFLIGHPDFLVYAGYNEAMMPTLVRGLEAKTTGWRQRHRWGDEGTDDIPREYLIQCQHYMGLTGLDRWDVAAFIERHYGEWIVLADSDFIGMICEECERFWRDYVLPQVRPPLEYSMQRAEAVKLLWPESNQDVMATTPAVDELARALREVRQKSEALAAKDEELATALQEIMGESAGVEGGWGRISWKSQERRNISWKDVATELKAPAELIGKHSKTQMVRPFRATFIEEEEA